MSLTTIEREILAGCAFASRDVRYFTQRGMTYARTDKTIVSTMRSLSRAGYLVEEVPGHWTTTLSGRAKVAAFGEVVRGHLVTNSSMTERYDGAELRPFAGRPGAMDAYALESRGHRT